MGTPFASFSDLEDRWRTLTSEEQDRADILLGDASNDIRLAAPGIDARIYAYELDPATVGALDPDVPLAVACAMVKRAMSGGGELEGVSSDAVTTGPFSNTRSYSNPMGNLYLSKAERKKIGAKSGTAFSINTAPDAGTTYVGLDVSGWC